MNYYNEIDPKLCAWIQELINEKLIPYGKIDCRSIADVQPSDLDGFTQCHFFTGISGWSLSLRLAGWPDDREVWTGSCPCQPFSCAGKGKGTADERHLWPEFHRLIKACKPPIIFGEQVASSEVLGTDLEAAFVDAVQKGDCAKANKLANKLVKTASLGFEHRWIDGIQADLEAASYTLGAADLPAACVGAPHRRQRLWWVAHPEHPIRRPLNVTGQNGRDGQDPGRQKTHSEPGTCSEVQRPANSPGNGPEFNPKREPEPRQSPRHHGLDNPQQPRLEGHTRDEHNRNQPGWNRANQTRPTPKTSQFSGWGNTWHPCADGKARRIPPVSQPVLLSMVDELPNTMDTVRTASLGFPLAQKIPHRTTLLKGCGNSITVTLGAGFIKAAMEEIKAIL